MYDELFFKGLEFVLKWEGGYVNDPDDAGGATNKGITQCTYDAFRKSKKLCVRNVKSIDDSEVTEIYFKNYWLACGCDKMHKSFALLVFDTAVNMGVSVAVGFLKPAKYKYPDKYLLARIQKYVAYARVGKQKKFLLGWLNRVIALSDFVNKECC